MLKRRPSEESLGSLGQKKRRLVPIAPLTPAPQSTTPTPSPSAEPEPQSLSSLLAQLRSNLAQSSTPSPSISNTRLPKLKNPTASDKAERARIRSIRNRQAAQVSRERKRQYVEQLEQNNSLLMAILEKMENSVERLTKENDELRQEVANLRVKGEGQREEGENTALSAEGVDFDLSLWTSMFPTQPAPAASAGPANVQFSDGMFDPLVTLPPTSYVDTSLLITPATSIESEQDATIRMANIDNILSLDNMDIPFMNALPSPPIQKLVEATADHSHLDDDFPESAALGKAHRVSPQWMSLFKQWIEMLVVSMVNQFVVLLAASMTLDLVTNAGGKSNAKALWSGKVKWWWSPLRIALATKGIGG